MQSKYHLLGGRSIYIYFCIVLFCFFIIVYILTAREDLLHFVNHLLFVIFWFIFISLYFLDLFSGFLFLFLEDLMNISFSRFGHHVSSIETNDGKWNVKTQQGEADNFDAVVLTMPVPQLFGLTGSVKELLGILSMADTDTLS